MAEKMFRQETTRTAFANIVCTFHQPFEGISVAKQHFTCLVRKFKKADHLLKLFVQLASRKEIDIFF